MTVLISGAGIAGLTLALSCHQAGIDCRIYEQVKVVGPLGVGINVQPHAVRELFELGLEDELDAIGIRTKEVAYYSSKGNLIWSEPRGMAAGYNWPQFSVHRGKLQMMLFDAVIDRLGPGAIVTNSGVDGYDTGKRQAHIQLAGSGERIAGDVIIACDGIHSAIRSQMVPGEGPPKWGGAVLWRATSLMEPFLSGATMAMAGHEWQKFVTYPLSEPDPATGKALINWIAELKFDPGDGWNREDWNRLGKLEDFLPNFEDWSFGWLDIPAMIQEAEACYEYPMVDRDPLEKWTDGRVTLMGDAAHPMYPIGSNGASQAIVDARVLVRAFQDHGVGPEALEAYEAERRPATSRIVLANRGNGPDQVMEVVHQRCGGEFGDISEVLSNEELVETAAAYKKLAGFDVDGLNSRAPIVQGADQA